MALRAVHTDDRTLPWHLPVVPEDCDRDPALSAAEEEAIRTIMRLGPDDVRRDYARAAKLALRRFEEPLAAVYALRRGGNQGLHYARRILYDAMLRRRRAFWGWIDADWLALLRPSTADFVTANRAYGKNADKGRPLLMDFAYLLGGVSDLRAVGMGAVRASMAETMFGADRLEAATRRLLAVLAGHRGLGYAGGVTQYTSIRSALALLMLLNRSPRLEDITVDLVLAALQSVTARPVERHLRADLKQIGVALDALGLLSWPEDPEPVADFADTSTAAEGVPHAWAAWGWSWYRRDTRLSPTSRQGTLFGLFAVGRWLATHHPHVTSPEGWDEDLALDYVSHLCNVARVGDDASPRGRRMMATKGTIGKPHTPQSIHHRLGVLRRAFSDWQDRPHAVDGAPARKIAIRFKPAQAFATPTHLRALIRPDPRDIDQAVWYKLAYAAANLTEQDLDRGHRYPLALYRAVALLWVTSARRMNEIVRLRVGCVRRDWDPGMLDEAGLPVEREGGALCYLHVPINKTRGAFWIWIPEYTADALETWERERPTSQASRVDRKDSSTVDLLFTYRNQKLGNTFLNEHLIPMLCRKAGVPLKDARGQITSHRGRSTRATLLRLLGVPLGDIAEYLGHANEQTVRHYARTNDTQLGLTIKQADERMRQVDGLIDLRAASAGRPNVFFSLGRGPDGLPRYCGNPAWSSCAHRLACQKCAMYVGGTAAELLEVRDEVLRFRSEAPMTPEEQAVTEGDVARLNERIVELEGVPTPAPPTPAFVFNPGAEVAGPIAPLPTVEEVDLRAGLAARLARLERDLAAAEATGGKRNILVRGLKNQIAGLREQLAASDLAGDRAAVGDEDVA